MNRKRQTYAKHLRHGAIFFVAIRIRVQHWCNFHGIGRDAAVSVNTRTETLLLEQQCAAEVAEPSALHHTVAALSPYHHQPHQPLMAVLGHVGLAPSTYRHPHYRRHHQPPRPSSLSHASLSQGEVVLLVVELARVLPQVEGTPALAVGLTSLMMNTGLVKDPVVPGVVSMNAVKGFEQSLQPYLYAKPC